MLTDFVVDFTGNVYVLLTSVFISALLDVMSQY